MTTAPTRLDAFASAHAMLWALRDRRISSAELIDIHMQRIERYNRELNAIVVPADDPLAAARHTDVLRGQGSGGDLLGLPVTLKESMNVPGMPTTVGVPDFKDYRATEMGAVPGSVLGAGAVLLGKTNVPPMLGDWQATNEIYGRTVNPWDPTRTPGGSTGGGAAAVAAGLSPLEFGSDIGGSIRVPAAFCGIFGHKPSETAVPRSGQFPFPPRPNAATVLGVQGPLARTADDLELGLRVIAGPEAGEDIAWRLNFPEPRAESLAGFRVAVMPRIEWLPVSAEILGALDALATNLAKAGATVREAAPATLGDMREHHALYVSMLLAFTSGPRSPEERARQSSVEQSNDHDGWGAARAATWTAGVGDWVGMHARREGYRADFRTFFRDWDILLAPITLRTAFPHVDMPWPPPPTPRPTTIDIDGHMHPYSNQLVYPALATLSGQPATAFPVGLSGAGLPMGLQAIGPYLEDFTSIRFAALVAREFGGFAPPPAFEAS
jgi:amidase